MEKKKTHPFKFTFSHKDFIIIQGQMVETRNTIVTTFPISPC